MKLVFQNNEHAAFVNEHYVPIKFVKNEGQYKELREFFNMIGFPTVVVLGPDGGERDRIVGFGGDAKAFMGKIKNWAENKNTLVSYRQQWEQDTTNVKLNYLIAERYIDRAQMEQAQPFLQNIVKFDTENSSGYVDFARFNLALYEARYESNPKPLEDLMDTETDADRLETAFFTLARFYEAQQDTQKTLGIYKHAVEKLPDNADLLNSAAWYVHSNKVADQFEWGVQLAERAVGQSPNDASIWDTLAWLYHDNGDYEKAVSAMQKAANLAPDTDYFKQTLYKMQTDLNQQAG